jgi:E3 ubiquitin-protein ligase HUWE1
MSRSSAKGKDPVEVSQSESDSSMSSDEGEEPSAPAGREETPDLYRNSALGMYGGVRVLFIYLFSVTGLSIHY